MIIVKLIGGLGNQLFQYAFARSLAITHDVSFKLDISSFDTYKLREYSLMHFNIIENFASESELRLVKKNYCEYWKNKLIDLLSPYHKKTLIKERKFTYDSELINNIDFSKKIIYFEGYWQTEKYFSLIKNTITKELELKTSIDDENKKHAESINRFNSVSIHIRRGDYVHNKNTQKYHGACGLDYYSKAVEIISSKVTEPYFFIFSDEPEWVENNLKLKFPTTYIKNNDSSKSHEDLKLMALCKHNIIANSTFSWWGAWLNKNNDKIIISPAKWFQTESIDYSDVIPNGWIKI